MKIIEYIQEMKELSEKQRKDGKTIGFVITMGFLHEGHLSLIRAARKDCDVVVVSIYVNPTQFAHSTEDFNKYPRDFEGDRKLCKEAGTDMIFYPSDEEMYPDNYFTFVNVEKLSEKLCGVTRPTHFKGVATIVLKLLNIVKPHKAYFGLKDYQQFIIVKKMIHDLNLDIETIGSPTVREGDGLAMSSRNTCLGKKEREQATVLYKSLIHAKELFSKGERDAEKLRAEIEKLINKTEGRIEYVELVDPDSFEKVTRVKEGDVIALAVFFGKIRLIDNVIL